MYIHAHDSLCYSLHKKKSTHAVVGPKKKNFSSTCSLPKVVSGVPREVLVLSQWL